MASILDILLLDTQHEVRVMALPNVRGQGYPREQSGRNPDKLMRWVQRNNAPGFGGFFCVGLIEYGKERKKENCRELVCAWTDIDFKDHPDTPPEEIDRIVRSLPLPPTRIHKTGHGLHLFWLLDRPAVGDDMDRVEEIVKRLVRHLGGDKQVTHRVALLRLPGTTNSKREPHVQVQVIHEGNERYTLNELEDWLDSEPMPVLIPRGRDIEEETNPFLRAAQAQAFHVRVNVEQRLKDMRFQGIGDSSVHSTCLSVTKAMVHDDMEEDEIVAVVMPYIEKLPEASEWDMRQEERTLRGMIRDAERKVQKQRRENGTLSAAASDDAGDETPSNVVSLKASSKNKPPIDKPKRKKPKDDTHVVIGQGILQKLADEGRQILYTEKQCWMCEDGIWSAMDDATEKFWASVLIEEGCLTLGVVSNTKIVNETRAWLQRQPQLHVKKVNWNGHGKIPTSNGLIDPKTLRLVPIRPTDYITWTLDVEYDPDADCAFFKQLLADAFADLPGSERTKTIGLIQEIFGMALLDTKAKALAVALALIGDSNTGKSEIISVFSGFFTDDPIATPLEQLEKNSHGTQAFARRAPWTLHEAFRDSSWHESDIVKRLLSGEPIGVNPKNGAPYTTRFTGPAFWAGNSMPKFKEATKAMVNRMIVIELKRTFNPEVKTGVAAIAQEQGYAHPYDMILAEEKSGLLNFALAGMQRAVARGYFVNTDAGQSLLEDIRQEANTVIAFLKDCFNFKATMMISTIDFYSAFEGWWAENRGRDTKPLSSTILGQKVAHSGLPVLQDKDKFKDRRSIRYYIGVELNEAGKELWGQSPNPQARGAPNAAEASQPVKDEWRGNAAVKKLIADERRRGRVTS